MNANTNLTVTGVDLGSSSAKIAAVLKGGVQIITNQASFRQTPNVVGLGEKERLIGQTGQVKIKSNYSNTVTAPSRFLGFDKSCPYLSEQLKFCPARAQKMQNENSRLTFNLQCGEERQTFTPQQLVASYLTELQKIIAHTNNLSNKNLVIAVPPYFTQHERQALMDAVQICKKKLNNEYATELINEEIAISMDYGYSKRNEFTDDLQKAHKVLFIDFGHSKTNLFVTAFNKQHMRVLSNKFDRQLGCKFMDEQLLKFYANEFDSAHPNMQLNLMESKKAVLKLLENIEKQRKVLSGNLEHDLSIECLLEDQDIYYQMKRDQYEKICQPVIDKFKNLLTVFFNELKQKGITFDVIELIGGGTRIPAIINVITQVFGQEPSRTINSNECIARGAALISAMNSTVFRVQPYSYFTTSPYTVELKVDGKLLDKQLIEKNELLLREKSVQFEVESSTQKFKLLAEYNEENLQDGLQTRIFECEVEIRPKSSQKIESTSEMKQELEEIKTIKLSMTISFDQSGLIKLDNIKSPNNQATVKVTKINYFEKFTSAELAQMEQKEKQMTIRDLKIKKFYEKKNQYESLIYKTKHNLNNILTSNAEYISEAQANQIKHFVQTEQNWLNSGLQINPDFKIEDFNKRQKLMNTKVDTLFTSINHLKQSHMLVNAELQKLADLLNEIISKRTQKMYPQEVDKVGEWINEVFQKQKSSPKYAAPIVSVEQIKQVYQNLISKIHEFDQQMERQRLMNLRRSKQPQLKPTQQSSYRPTESSYHPYGNYGGRQYQDDYYKPKTTRSGKGGYQNKQNPFGSFFGSGFF